MRDVTEFPDIGEMVEAIRRAVDAADAYNAAHPDEPQPVNPEWESWTAAFAGLRAMVERVDAASSDAFGGDAHG